MTGTVGALGPSWRQPLTTFELTEFERRAREGGSKLRATQFAGSAAEVTVSFLSLDDVVVSSIGASELVGLEWQERPATVNLSICCGPGRVLLEGRERAIPSIIVYSEPAHGTWAGQIVPSPRGAKPNLCYHISLPLELGRSFGIPIQFLERSWFEFTIDENVARRFARWADTQAQATEWHPPTVRQEALTWVGTLIDPVAASSVCPTMPKNYARIISAVGDQLDRIRGPVSVTGLADEIHVSTRTLQRAFNTTFGVGAKRYVRARQLLLAHELLLRGEHSVSGAAYSVGFPHPSRFSRQYFDQFGVYPSQTLANSGPLT